jgi:hypothetical protein
VAAPPGAGSTTALIPILGARSLEQLDATLGALHVELSPEQLMRLDSTSAVALGTPHEKIDAAVASVAGGNAHLLERPNVPVA